MIKPYSLQPLVHLAQQKNEAATRKFGQLNQQQQAAQTKLDALLQYRKDYQTRFQEAVQNGMNQSDLRNFQNFIQRLREYTTKRGINFFMAPSNMDLQDLLLKQLRKSEVWG